MLQRLSGTPFQGYAQLTNGSPGPKSFNIVTTIGTAGSTILAANLRVYIVNITLSSNDATPALVTMDSGGTTPTKFISAYMSAAQQLQPEEIPPGILRGIFGTMPRIGATAVSGGATVECVIQGYVSNT